MLWILACITLFSIFVLHSYQLKVRDCFQGLQLKRYIDTTLGQGDLGEAVRLPIGENLNEWLAVHSKS